MLSDVFAPQGLPLGFHTLEWISSGYDLPDYGDLLGMRRGANQVTNVQKQLFGEGLRDFSLGEKERAKNEGL
jgi:hypothetical protein